MQFSKKEKNKLILLALAAAWFYVIPLLYELLFVNSDNPQKVVALIEQDLARQENKFNTISNQTEFIRKLATNSFTQNDLELTKKLPYGLQIYKVAEDSTFQLLFWNKNNILPQINELLQRDGKYSSNKENGNHQFVKKTMEISNDRFVVSALMPLHWDYFIETDYLKKEFTASNKIERKFTVANEPTIYPVKNSENTILFYLKNTTDNRNKGFSWVYLLSRVICLAFIGILMFYFCSLIAKNKNFVTAFIVFTLLVVLLRVVCFIFNFPFQYNIIEYFDPRIYAANNLFKSLGDLTLNLFSSFLLVLFWVKYNTENNNWPSSKIVGFRITDLIRIIAFVFVSFYSIWIFRSLISNSKISFNVTNFFSLSLYSLYGFLHIAFLIIIYYLFTQRVLKIATLFKQHTIIYYFIAFIVGLIFLFSNFYWSADIENIFFLLWMLLYLFLSQKLYTPSTISIFSINIFWMLFFSLFAAILFNYENNKKELVERKWLAEKIAFQSDPSTENLLNIALSKFDNNFLIKNYEKFYNPAISKSYKDTLLNENFVGYLNKFETKFYSFDSLERPLFNEDSTKFAYFNTVLKNQVKRVNNIPDLFFYETGFDLFSYIYKKDIVDTSGKIVGYFIAQSNPLSYKNKSSALSPELFKQRNARLEDNGNNYIYAVYNNYELRKRFFDYDLPTRISADEIPIQDDTIKIRNGYEELWLKLNKTSVVVVGKKQSSLISLITLFAYIFFSILVVNYFLSFCEIVLQKNRDKKFFSKFVQLNFSQQVQAIVWMVSLITFVVVTFVIISLFKSRFDKSNKERLSRTMSILIADVQNKLANNSIFDDVVKVYEPEANAVLKESIFQLSEVHNVDFNVYDLNGTLKLSSQPLLETKSILSNKIDPTAFYYLNRKTSSQFVQQEKIGTFDYLSMYVPIRDENGKAYGYLNIPYYSSQSDLNQEISNFIITILNLTAFVFLIAGLIAWLVTNRITNSFSIIGNKMKEVSLGKNEIIEWTKDDELGGLVKEYNKMVMKLEESANNLAKSEREGAWREMARQVAHEIKNPLTPMKLSIQYLQKSIENGNTNIKELTNTVSKTLVEQIDHLSNIASDFSQFANIVNPKNEKINLIPLLQSLQQLFGTETNVTVQLSYSTSIAYIEADKTQMNRLFTNLIKNAIQAYDLDKHKLIDINVITQGNSVIVMLQDFANGISKELQEKIFTPNFTTKTSGTGLGLAISKGIVENAKGKIWFSTELNKGTIFYVELPLVES